MRRPPAAFVGRTAELTRARSVLGRVPVLALCGVGGVGKSAFARVLAQDYAHAFSTTPSPGSTLERICADALRALGHSAPTVLDVESALSTLAGGLDDAAALWVLEDLHLLGRELRGPLLDAFAEYLDQGRLLATSRESTPPTPRGPDRAELRLNSLSLDEGKELWNALDELHGPTPRFDAAWGVVGGNPLLLRCAHAGAVDQLDPIADSVSRLEPEQLRAAGLLALHRRPLPTSALTHAGGDPDSIRRLLETLIIDVDAAGQCSMHDVCAAAVIRQLDDATLRALRVQLFALIESDDSDIVANALDLRRHAVALAEPERIAPFLLRNATALIRAGAVGVLVDGLETLPDHAVNFDVAMVHARALIRRLDLRAAHEVLLDVDHHYPERAQVRAVLGVVAYLRGYFEDAESALRFAVEHPETPETLRSRARLSLAYCLTYQGRGDEARRLLTEAGSPGWSIEDREIGVAFTWWLEEDTASAERAMTPGFHDFRDDAAGLHAAVLRPVFYATVRARNGRLSEWPAVYEASSAAAESEQDVRLMADRVYQRVEYLFCSGALDEALDEALRARKITLRGDYRIAAWSFAVFAGRCLHLLGRRREALALLERTRTEAQQAGAKSVLAAVERSTGYDGVQRVADASTQPIPRVDPCAHLALIRAAAEGRPVSIPTETSGLPGALAHLVQSTLALARGAALEAEEQLTLATQLAIEAGADPDFISALRDAIGTRRMHTPEGTRLVEGPDTAAITLDAATHRLVYSDGELSVARRPVVRKLFYALAASAGTVVDKDGLVRAIWGREYNPLQDDNPLKVNVRNLRKLVEGTGLRIEFEGSGYRLIAERSFVFTRP